MDILMDDKGQGAAEYILLFGGVIVIAIVALGLYSTYLKNGPYFANDEVQVRENVANNG
ncbi:MAG: class III signal peptide-containing protein [Euryarchaeota archaeon]|nr:class III signal peptide-containing protein [Euryarchaeota archaeon]